MFVYGNNFHQLTMLKVVERKAFNQFFNDYNPVRQDLWAEINRPWDDDHIIPNNWVKGKQSSWRETCKRWVNSIGNFAHIPFEKNREKNANADWEFYMQDQNAELLHFEKEIACTATSENNPPLQKDFVYHEESVRKFIELTQRRFCNIYHDFLEILKPLRIGEVLSDAQEKRKQLLLEFKTDSTELYCKSGENNVVFTTEDSYCWILPSLSISTTNSDGMLTAITINLSQKQIGNPIFSISVEIRQDSNMSSSDSDDNVEVRDFFEKFRLEDFTNGQARNFIENALYRSL